MRRASLTELTADARTCLDRDDGEPIIVTDGDRAVGLFIAMSDEDDLERLALALSPQFQRILGEARERVRREGTLSHEEFWRAVEERYGTVADTRADEA